MSSNIQNHEKIHAIFTRALKGYWVYFSLSCSVYWVLWRRAIVGGNSFEQSNDVTAGRWREDTFQKWKLPATRAYHLCIQSHNCPFQDRPEISDHHRYVQKVCSHASCFFFLRALQEKHCFKCLQSQIFMFWQFEIIWLNLWSAAFCLMRTWSRLEKFFNKPRTAQDGTVPNSQNKCGKYWTFLLLFITTMPNEFKNFPQCWRVS